MEVLRSMHQFSGCRGLGARVVADNETQGGVLWDRKSTVIIGSLFQTELSC